MTQVTIIICTRNHAESLRRTLEALRVVRVPEGIAAELIVADNGSTDRTAQVVRAAALPGFTVRHVIEARSGQCFARNAGVAAASGEIILFTDDDMRFPPHWLEGMCRPILRGDADAVAGGIQLAPHLQRAWMGSCHRSWLAATDALDPREPVWMIGANMAFARRVLGAVPAFDTELDPGGLGYGGDTLFSLQIRRAGFRIAGALDVQVEHHFDTSRLLRGNFIAAARRFGRSQAYVGYHWEHWTLRHPWWPLADALARLAYWSARQGWRCVRSEGMPERVMQALSRVHTYLHYLEERKRPRNYEQHGLIKLPATAHA